MKYTLLTLFSFTALCSSVQASELKDFLATKTVVLDRPLVTFHYRSWNEDPPSQEAARNLVHDASVNFFRADLDKDHNVVGPGFYVAVDPAATRMYGNLKPQLYAVTLKKGSRVLDARSVTDEKEIKALKKAAAQFNCTEAGKHPDLSNFRNSHSKICQGEFMKAMRELEVDAILYGYSGSGSLKNCRTTRDMAWNIISAKNIEPKDVGFYSDTTRFETKPTDGALIYKLFLEGNLDPTLDTFGSGKQPPPQKLIDGPEVTEKEYEEFKAESVWKCGPLRVAEFNRADNFTQYYKRAMVSGGFNTLMNELRTAMAARGQVSFHQVNALRGLVYMQYQNAGMARDGSKFQQYLKAYFNSLSAYASLASSTAISKNEVLVQKVAELFEEKVKPLPVKEAEYINSQLMLRVLSSDKDMYSAYPGIYYQTFRAYGAGPRMTTAMMNSSLPIPIVIGQIPTDPDRDMTSFMTKNRDFVLRFLRQCIDKYRNTSLNMDVINNSECGMIESYKYVLTPEELAKK